MSKRPPVSPNPSSKAPAPVPPKLYLDKLQTGGGWGLGEKFSRLPNREDQLREATNKTIYSVTQGSEQFVHDSDVSSSDSSDALPYGANVKATPPATSAAVGGGGSLATPERRAASKSPSPSASPAAERASSATPAPSSGPTSAFAQMMQRRMAVLAGAKGTSGGEPAAGSNSPNQLAASLNPPTPRQHHTQAFQPDHEEDDDNTFVDYGPRGAGAGEGLPTSLGGAGSAPRATSSPAAANPTSTTAAAQQQPSPAAGGSSSGASVSVGASQPNASRPGRPPVAPSVVSGLSPAATSLQVPIVSIGMPSPQGLAMMSPQGIAGVGMPHYGASGSSVVVAPQLKEPAVEQIFDSRGNWRPGTIVSSLLLPPDLPFRTMAMAEAGVGGASAPSLWVSMGSREPISMFDLSGCELNAQRNVNITDVTAMAVVVVRALKKQPVGEKFRESRASQGQQGAGGGTGGRGFGRGGFGGYGAGARGADSAAATLAAASIAAHQKQQAAPQYEDSAYLWCGTEKGAIAFVDLVLANEDGVMSNAHAEPITYMCALPRAATGGVCRVWTCSARDRHLRVWDGATRRNVAKKVLPAPVTDCAAIPPDVAPHVWTCSGGEAAVRVWDYDGKERTHARFPPNSNALRFKAEVRFVRYHHASQLMWVCCVTCVMLVNPKTYEVLQSLPIIALALEFRGPESPHTAIVLGFTTLDGKSNRPSVDSSDTSMTNGGAHPHIFIVECPFSSGRLGNDASFVLTRDMITMGQRLPDINGLTTPLGSTSQWTGFKLFGGQVPFAVVPHMAPPRGASHISIFTTETCEPTKGWGGGLFGAAGGGSSLSAQQQQQLISASSNNNMIFPSSGASGIMLGGSGVFGGAPRGSFQGGLGYPPRSGAGGGGPGSVVGGGSVAGGRVPFVGPRPAQHPVFQQAQHYGPRGSVVGGAGLGAASTHSMIKPLARAMGGDDRDGQSTEGTFVVRDTPQGSVMGGGGAHAALFGGGGGGMGAMNPAASGMNLAASVASFNNSVIVHKDVGGGGGGGDDRPQWMAMLSPAQQQQAAAAAAGGTHQPIGQMPTASSSIQFQSPLPMAFGGGAAAAAAVPTAAAPTTVVAGPPVSVTASIDPSLARTLKDLSDEVKRLKSGDQILKDFAELSTFAQSQKFRLITVAGSAAAAEESEEAMAMAQRIGLPNVEGPEARVVAEVLTYMTVRTMLIEKERADLAARCAALEKALLSSSSVSAAVAEVAANHFGLRGALGGGELSLGGKKGARTVTIPQELFNAYLTASATASASEALPYSTVGVDSQQHAAGGFSPSSLPSASAGGTGVSGSPSAGDASPATPAQGLGGGGGGIIGLGALGGVAGGGDGLAGSVLMGGSAVGRPPPSTTGANFASPHSPMPMGGSPRLVGGGGAVVRSSSSGGRHAAAAAAASAAHQQGSGGGGGSARSGLQQPQQQQGGGNGPAAAVAAAGSTPRQEASLVIATANVRALQQLCTAQAAHVRLLSRQNRSLQEKLGECEEGLARLEASLVASVTTILGPAMAESAARKEARAKEKEERRRAKEAEKEAKRSRRKHATISAEGGGETDDKKGTPTPSSLLPEGGGGTTSSSLSCAPDDEAIPAHGESSKADLPPNVRTALPSSPAAVGVSSSGSSSSGELSAKAASVFKAYRRDIECEIRNMRSGTVANPITAAFGHAGNAMLKLVWMARQYGAAVEGERRARAEEALRAMASSASGSRSGAAGPSGACAFVPLTASQQNIIPSSSAAVAVGSSGAVTAAVTATAGSRQALVMRHTAAVALLPPSHVSAIGALAPRDKAELLRVVIGPCLASLAEGVAGLSGRRATATDALRLAYEQGVRGVMRRLALTTATAAAASSPLSATSEEVGCVDGRASSPQLMGVAADATATKSDSDPLLATGRAFADAIVTQCDVTTSIVFYDVALAAAMARLCLSEGLLAVVEATLHELARWAEEREAEEGVGGGGGLQPFEENGGVGAAAVVLDDGAAAGPPLEALHPSFHELNKPLIEHRTPSAAIAAAALAAEEDGSAANGNNATAKADGQPPVPSAVGVGGAYVDPEPLQHQMAASAEEVERCSAAAIAIGVDLEALAAQHRSGGGGAAVAAASAAASAPAEFATVAPVVDEGDVAARRVVTEELVAFLIPLQRALKASAVTSSSFSSAPHSPPSPLSPLLSAAMRISPAAAVGGLVRLYAEGASAEAVGAWTSQWRLSGCLAWGHLWARFVGESLDLIGAVVAHHTTASTTSLSAAAVNKEVGKEATATEGSPSSPSLTPLTAEHVAYLLDLLLDWRAFAREVEGAVLGPLLAAVRSLGTTAGDGDTKAGLSAADEGGVAASSALAGSDVLPSPAHTRLFSLYLQHACRSFAAVGVHPTAAVVTAGAGPIGEPFPPSYRGPTDTSALPAALARSQRRQQGSPTPTSPLGGAVAASSATEEKDAAATKEDPQANTHHSNQNGAPIVFDAAYVASCPAAQLYAPAAFGIRGPGAAPTGARGAASRRGGGGSGSGPADALVDFFALTDSFAADAEALGAKLRAARGAIAAAESSLRDLLVRLETTSGGGRSGGSNGAAMAVVVSPATVAVAGGVAFRPPQLAEGTMRLLETIAVEPSGAH